MARVLIIAGIVLFFSLGMNAVLQIKLQKLDETIVRLEMEKNVLETARKADAAAIEALRNAQTEAMRHAQQQRETLQSLDDLDDAAFCERIGSVWEKRRAAGMPSTTGGFAR